MGEEDPCGTLLYDNPTIDFVSEVVLPSSPRAWVVNRIHHLALKEGWRMVVGVPWDSQQSGEGFCP